MQTEALYDEIPSLDLADFSSGDADRKAIFVQNLGRAFNQIGFVAIRNHGLTDDLTKRLYESAQAFFSAPDAVKQQYEHPELNGQRGYIGKGKETAKGFKVADLKEFYHIGQPEPVGDMPANVLPTEYPEFSDAALTAYQTLENAGKTLLRAIALYLELPETYFDDKVQQGRQHPTGAALFPARPDHNPRWGRPGCSPWRH
jgi:isopenicillin N synthase-like dioxygenase